MDGGRIWHASDDAWWAREGARPVARPMADELRKQWSKRHGVAVKQGIQRARAHKKVVKKATLALRTAPSKQAIVQRLFTPKPAPPEEEGEEEETTED